MDPSWLEIEITESGLISNLDFFLEILQSIRDKGLSLAIDDFGTGYSNFSYLNILPVNKLKIDKSFIQDQSEKGKSIVLTVLALAKKLNLKVVGEGIETISQLEFLFKNQCDEAQGYYFSKPLPRLEFNNFMNEHRFDTQDHSNSNKSLKTQYV